ncbi:MAG: DsrE family protein [Gammaproteobacteria bacterium]|nr:DsrE family protein [Gammaproteobacteria bacterium]MDH5778959.1 DsrE family protein [Gammaproteobacteria bacterium]
MYKKFMLTVLPLVALLGVTPVMADDDDDLCPVGLVTGKTLDGEFGPGSQDATRCLDKRNKVKIVMQVNKFCRDAVANADCTRPYALGNMVNMIKDYEITHGMVQGEDYEMVAVVHSGGAPLILKNEGFDGKGVDNAVTGRNQFEGLTKSLIAQGVKFYFCQNTTRGYIKANRLPSSLETAGGATAEMIEGVEYVTAGVTAIGDFQKKGYKYVQP